MNTLGVLQEGKRREKGTNVGGRRIRMEGLGKRRRKVWSLLRVLECEGRGIY